VRDSSGRIAVFPAEKAMNKKKVNTAAFVLTATIVNVILMSFLFLIAYSAYQILAGRRLPPGINLGAVFLLFAGSVVLTYFVHKRLVRFLLKKTSLGKILRPPNVDGPSPPQDTA
jgi:membrane protein implicated in regulation of membrane protease activity